MDIKDYIINIIKKKVNKINIVLNINNDLCRNQKKVAIVYIDNNFKTIFEKQVFHSQVLEMNQIVKEFINRDYCIDIINCHEELALEIIKDNKYDVIFGLSDIFYNLCILNSEAKRIIYVTENHPRFSLEKESERINYYYERYKRKFPILRSNLYFKEKHFNVVDYAILMGESNYFTNYSFPIKTIEPTGLVNNKYIYRERNYEKSKKNFLWFGGKGAIHKGLDLLIDVFSNREDIILHICGLDKKEKRRLKIKQKKNIKIYGTISIYSDTFLELVNKCNFIILPSCSEAHSTGILTGMMHSLIPIVMENSGFSRLDNKCIFLKSFKIDYLNSKLSEISNYNNSYLKKMEIEVYEFSRNKFNIKSYSYKLKEIFDEFNI